MYDTYMTSQVGVIHITSNGNGITSIAFVNDIQDDHPDWICEECKRQLQQYFSKQRKEFQLPLALKGTAFQMKVWKELCEIPYGEVRTYKQIAIACGNVKACRAVGMANHNNPIAIVVPCHRVIGSNGKLTGYASGIAIKKALLDLEKK